MPIQFNASPDPTIGVEVELQIVDPTTRQLVAKGGDLIASLNGNPHVKSELLQSTVELNTSVCQNVKEARADLEHVMGEVHSACKKLECAFISAGTHPFSTWPEQQITDEERYQKLINRVQWPAQRLMIFGLHVHVGMDSGEKAVAVGVEPRDEAAGVGDDLAAWRDDALCLQGACTAKGERERGNEFHDNAPDLEMPDQDSRARPHPLAARARIGPSLRA